VADIFREVNEELKRDRASELARKYGPYLIGFAVAIVLGTLGYNLWRDWDLERRSERSDQFNAALELASDGQNDAAVAALAELGEPDGAYGTLAAFERARLLAEDGRLDEALAAWEILAASDAAGPALQGVARLFFVMHQIDDGDPGELRVMLEPLFVAGNGFRPLAMELNAVLMLREGDRAAARQIYAEIADDLTAPPGLRARAAQVLASLAEGRPQ
jgi:hypothetical protein